MTVANTGRATGGTRFKRPTLEERRVLGKSQREAAAFTDHAKWQPAAQRDVIAIITESNQGRLSELIPLKMGRMAVSPFAFFRGSAPLMAYDLKDSPVAGISVQLCGDAHVRNLGAYAGPDGHLVFDLNDFDEAVPGPFEWDLKRLATSVILAGREAGCLDSLCLDGVRELMRGYRESITVFSTMKVLELAKFQIRRLSRNMALQGVYAKAERSTPDKSLKALTEMGADGWPRFHDNPPVLKHVPDEVRDQVLRSLVPYSQTLGAARQLILSEYHAVDVAFKVVGTGSVGTRDYVVLLFGNGLDDPMVLQVKEAVAPCYTPYLSGLPKYKHHGQRVAQAQQRSQTATDPFLGWTTIERRDFLVRQLSDHKAAFNLALLKGRILLEYALVCGETLAKAHARTGDPAQLAGYCGRSAKLDDAIAGFALQYANQTTSDYETFLKAIIDGKIEKINEVKTPAVKAKKAKKKKVGNKVGNKAGKGAK